MKEKDKCNAPQCTAPVDNNSHGNFYISIKCYINIYGLLSVLHG